MNKVTYRGIKHNILNDAPFIGALIIANSCKMECKDCINEHLKNDNYIIQEYPSAIIEQVLSNRLNSGIILSGLEWSEQKDDLINIVHIALDNNLKVMIYTHHNEDTFFTIVPGLKKLPIYVKFGFYNNKLIVDDNIQYGIKLATSNQYIKKFY
jgi:hypothetical protein